MGQMKAFFPSRQLIVIPRRASKPPHDLRFVAGVLNSKAMTFFYRTTYNTLHVQTGELSSLPLPRVNPNNPREKAAHDEVCQAVDAIIELDEHSRTAKTERDIDLVRRRQASLENRIETLVCELFGLSVADRALIETIVRKLN